jgi:hypothetical protein
MRVRRKEPCLLPSGCKADLAQRPVSSTADFPVLFGGTIESEVLIAREPAAVKYRGP